MKAIKGLVIFMGVLLLVGLGLLGYGMSAKVRKPESRPVVAEARFGAVEVPLPAGSRVEQMVVAGERVVLRVVGGGPERLVVLDPAAGRVAGSFTLAPEPPFR